MAQAETIFDARVAIRAETAQLRADLQRAQTEMRGGLLSLQGLARNLAPTLSIAGLGAFLNHVANIGDQLSDLADKTGLSIEVLGGIKPVLDASNSSLDSFANGFVRFQRSLGDITGDGKAAAAALEAIGLNASEIAKLSPDAALEKLVTALGKVENGNIRNAIATRLFSRAGADLLPTITQLADNGITKLDSKTAQAYRSLGTFKDQLVLLGGNLANIAAGPLAGFVEKLEEILKLLSLLPQTGAEKIEGLKGTIESLNKSVASSLGKSPGEIALFFSNKDLENLAKARDTLPATKAAIDQLIKARERMKALEKDTPFNAPKSGGVPSNFGALPNQDLKKADDESRSFIQSLEKQADALRQSQVELTQGATAAKAYGLDLEFAAFKQKLIQDGKPIPAGLDADFQRVKTLLIDLTNESDRLKASLEQSFSARRFAEEEQEFAAIAAEQKRNLDELNRATEEGIRLRATQPANLQQQLVRNIEAQLAKEKEEAAFLESVYGPSFERAAADVEALKKAIEALKAIGIGGDNAVAVQFKADLDRRTLDRNVDELRRSEILLNVKAQLGFDVDTLGPQIELLRRQIEESILKAGSVGSALADPTVRAQAGQLKDTIVTKEFTDLRREIDLAGKQAQVFGSEFDSVGTAMDATRRAIEKLLREGLDPLDPRIQSLRGQLEGLKQLDLLGRVADSIGDNFANALDGVFDEGVDFGDKLKNLFKNIAKDISREFAREAGRELSGALRGLLFGQNGGVGGAVGGIGGGILGPLLQQFSSQISSWIGSLFSSGAGNFASSVDVGSFFNIAHQGGFVADDGTIKRFATGGMVNGAGEVPAILHTGEFVLRKAIVDAIGVDTLQRLNKGSFQAFEMGGLVMASNAIRSTRPADLRPQTTDGERGGRRSSPEVRVEVNGSIIKNPNIPDEQVIRVWAKDYRGWGVTRAIVKGDR